MTPKDKAGQLYNTYFDRFDNLEFGLHDAIIGCALICIDEITKELSTMYEFTDKQASEVRDDYWSKVKQEIEKL